MSTDEHGSTRTGRGPEAMASSSLSAATKTPRVSNRRRTHKQLSAKRLDKIVKNLASVQRSVGHLRSESIGSLSHIGEETNEPGLDNVVLGEDGKREIASYAIDAGEDGLANALTEVDLNHPSGTEAWLQRRGVDRSLIKGLGKGPDGISLAMVAAKGLSGQESAPPDSFLHEASFVFNPLTRRVPHQTPRKQAHIAADRSHTKISDDPAKREGRSGVMLPPKGPFIGKSWSSNSQANPNAAEIRSEELLSEAPKEIQEALILEDLLFIMTGIEGQYIQYGAGYTPDDLGSRLKGATFSIDPALDPSLRDLVSRIIPLSTHYTAIFAFVETQSSLEFGTVMHAMCAAIRNLLKEYEVLVIQLEHQMTTSPSFTLQKLWFYVYPTLQTFALLHNFLTEIISISHANVLDSDDEVEDSSEDDDDDDSDGFEQRRRQLLGLNDIDDEDSIVGGIVKGGEVLSMLYDRVVKMGGDETARKLFKTLLHHAAQPYAHILLRWITTGHLSDTYEEFLVMENPKVSRASLESDPTDEFWERRYTLRDETMLEQKEHERQQGFEIDDIVDEEGIRGVLTGGAKIPAFLEPWKRKILLAGKYLNVIRECGRDVPAMHEPDGNNDDREINITDDAFFQRVEAAYQRANTALLSLLLDEHNIVPRLRSMKHYFFQSHSDFFSSFLEAAHRELEKDVLADRVREVTVMRLQSQLGMVLGSSNCVAYTDPFREDVRIQLASENAYDQLKRIAEIKGGLEAARAQARLARQKDKEYIKVVELLQFDLAVKFPVSLVISKKNILRWQFLQRPIIHLKATERSLCEVWTEHQCTEWKRIERGHTQLQRWKGRIFRLRHRILFFVQQVLAFITSEVLEPNWRDLEAKMERATTVDQFLKDHFDFLNLCRKECMLTDLRFVEMMSKLMNVAAAFCSRTNTFRDQLFKERSIWQRDLLDAPQQIDPPTVSEDVLGYLTRLEDHWEKRLSTFKDIVALLSTTDNPAALPLSYRLQSA